jgi:hypothetical protein
MKGPAFDLALADRGTARRVAAVCRMRFSLRSSCFLVGEAPAKIPRQKPITGSNMAFSLIPQTDNGFSSLVLVGAVRIVTLILCRTGQFWRIPQAALLRWTPPIVDRISLRGLVVARCHIYKNWLKS